MAKQDGFTYAIPGELADVINTLVKSQNGLTTRSRIARLALALGLEVLRGRMTMEGERHPSLESAEPDLSQEELQELSV